MERKALRQWVLKITAYAERLLQDLDLLDWPESLKRHQRNWIGKSEGAEIAFALESGDDIKVFTTCPDTIFGVTYLVLSPEHPLVSKIASQEQREAVSEYQRESLTKSDLARTELAEEKSGVFTGAYATHPFTGKRVPIWTADYVLMGYGTGAVMGVPAHDARDFDFAKKYGLPIVQVIRPEDPELAQSCLAGEYCFEGEGTACSSSFLDGLQTQEAKRRAIAAIEEKGVGKAVTTYRLRDWLFSRQRYWGEPVPILHFADGTMRSLELDELPLTAPELTDFKPTGAGQSPLARITEWVEVEDAKTGRPARRETNTMPQWAGSCWYYLRFCDPRNTSEAWSHARERYWMPVDLYVGGAEHAVLHLLYARFWHKVLYDAGLLSTIEPFQKLLNQGLVVSRSYKRPGGHYLEADEVVERDGKYYHWESGELLESQIEKMSKSKLNGVSPDQVIKEFGADAVRLYILFMGPIEKEKVWNTESVHGCRRFLNRVYEMATSEKVIEEDTEEGLRLAHRLVSGVTHDIEKLYYNTAIAKMMEFVNEFSKLSHYPKNGLKMVAQLLSPFAPHIAEELWSLLGGAPLASNQSFPKADPKYLVDETITYVVQVNGKVRARVELAKDLSEGDLLKAALADANVSKYVTGTIAKVVFVPNRLLNLVLA